MATNLVTQTPVEVLTGSPTARITQSPVEILTGSPIARLTQCPVEVIVNIVPLVTQVAVEVVEVNDQITDDAETMYYRRYLNDVRRNVE